MAHGISSDGSKAPFMTPELEHLRGLIRQLGLTNARIGERLGLSESHVKNILCGWHRMPSDCAARIIGCQPTALGSAALPPNKRECAVAFPLTGTEYAECLAACLKTDCSIEKLAALATMNVVHAIISGRVTLPRKERRNAIP